jgi:hypothetical protein
LLAALTLTLGTAVANAEASGLPGSFGGGTQSSQALVVGTVVSVDPGTNSFVADAYVVQPPSLGSLGGILGGLFGGGGGGLFGGGLFGGGGGGLPFGSGGLSGLCCGSGTLFGTLFGGHFSFGGASAPTTTRVTITTDSNTKIVINGKVATVSDLAAGDKFGALFSGSPTDSIETLVTNPPIAVFAKGSSVWSHPQLYGFVGTVTAVDTTAGTVTVNVRRTLPSSLAPSGSSATFTVGPHTLILAGGSLFGASLSDVSVGDVVAGGELAPAGETLAQVEATPLKVLIDLPTTTTTGSAVRHLKRAIHLKHGKKHHHSKKHHAAKKH